MNRVNYAGCPICGSRILKQTMRTHVGSYRCKTILLGRDGRYADPVRGPEILSLVKSLESLLYPSGGDS
jgi:endogenous inhibitor of DNA gyrase (YacG/DUF329 family)